MPPASFKEARRQLQDYVRQLPGDVKTHESAPGGVVTKLLPEDGYGFVETPDGREVYFHAKCILDVASDEIGISSEVRFVEEVGEKGLQATSVRLVERHHHLIE